MRELCPNSVGCKIARFCGDLDQGLDCRCLCKSGEVSMDRASIGLITGNYSLRAMHTKSPSSTITFILYNMSKWADKRHYCGVPVLI